MRTAAGIQCAGKQYGVATVSPGIPVTHEQLVEYMTGCLHFGLLIKTFFSAGQIGAVAEYFNAQRNPVIVWRQTKAGYIQRQVGHHVGFTAVQWQTPDLIRAGTS